MSAALALGVILSTGVGVDRIQPPDMPFLAVRSARWSHVRPEDSQVISSWAVAMRNTGVKSLGLVASSKGVPVAQKAASESPKSFNGGIVFVSGAGGPEWKPYQFSTRVLTPVLLMCGLDESDRMIYRMDILNNLLLNHDKEACLRFYDGKHGFLAENEEAQSDMREFLKWTLAGGERPEWFTKCPK